MAVVRILSAGSVSTVAVAAAVILTAIVRTTMMLIATAVLPGFAHLV
jgi:hypothetical protein